MKKLLDDVMGILKAPFVGQLDLSHLFLIVGVVIIFAGAWFMILRHVRLAASEVV